MNFGEVHRLNQGKRGYDKSVTTDSSITLTRTYQPSRSAFSFHDPGSDEYSMKRSAMEIVLFAVQSPWRGANVWHSLTGTAAKSKTPRHCCFHGNSSGDAEQNYAVASKLEPSL